MKEIAIDYTVGNLTKKLLLGFTSMGMVQIRMDRYYHGQAIYSQDQWRVYLADKSELNNSDDIQALIQILTEQDKK